MILIQEQNMDFKQKIKSNSVRETDAVAFLSVMV